MIWNKEKRVFDTPKVPNRPTAFFTRGIPSSLKTATAEFFSYLGTKPAVISKDQIRHSLFPNRHYLSLSFEELVTIEEARDAWAKIVFEQNRCVIFDETFIDPPDLMRALNLVPSHYVKILLDQTWMPFEWCLKLDQVRDEPRGFDSLFDYYQRLQKHPSSKLVHLFDDVFGEETKFWAEGIVKNV